MRRILCALLGTVLALSLAACGGTSGGAASTTAEQTPAASSAPAQSADTSAAESTPADASAETAKSQDAGGDTLVVYFSRMGNTDFPEDVDVVASASLLDDHGTLKGNAQVMAEWIAAETGGNLFEIQTEDKYPEDYAETTDVAKEEQNEGARPALAAQLEGLEDYQTVHLVFPNWWGDLPMPVYTFFDTYDFAGKRLIVSCTHGGSAFSDTIATISALEPEAEVVQGTSVAAGDVAGAHDAVTAWVNGL